ncbi:histidine-type phosphatase [Novosphingobium sp. KACC 22771]|uniref:histidine-type phosphatase n=1 Tax=Novosphingobium sp. KACC 22771 TaxID=3025670 RepID=UPI00236597BA|nr:histidine-type phosphatase [Novosphingobium sp. KACC 22771]WDF74543.1 histidine-type phosphatase [Novosphingobium sp. KACC 22771]
MRKMMIAAIAALAWSVPAWTVPAYAAGPVVESVVVLMRHGIRPPTKDPAMPAGTAAAPWPRWDVPPGWLTAHGGEAVESLGVQDGAWLRRIGVLPVAGCPDATRLHIVADSDQRTIATGQHWVKGALSHCAPAFDHLPQDQDDPRFGPLSAGLARIDPGAAALALDQAVGPQGLAGIDRRLAPLYARLNAILCGGAAAPCGIGVEPTRIRPATAQARPKLSGMLDRASTAAQILLLEYADGKPMGEVGWGRASAGDIAVLSTFHAEEFRLLARPRPLAAPNLAGLAPVLREGLEGRVGLALIVGHDTNIANLAGLLGLHWRVDGLAADDPSPGGAIMLEVLRMPSGRRMVRASYRSQTLAGMRSGKGAALRHPMVIEACHDAVRGMCPLDQVLGALGR